MEISFHPHALKKIKERGIDKAIVIDILQNPDRMIESKYNRKIAQKVFGCYVIRTIYEEKDNKILIITAYKAKAKRYK